MKNFVFFRASSYLQIARMGAQVNFAYRANVFSQLAGVIFQIYLLQVIWADVYLHSSNINHIQLHTLVSYITLTNLQTWVLAPTATSIVQNRIRTGDLSLDLVKPMGLPGLFTAQQFGMTLSLLPFALIALVLALFTGGIQAPASVASFALYIVSFLLGYCVAALIGLLMGLASLWTFEVAGIQLIYRFVAQIFAGALIPLWLFPPVLRTAATFLPFQAIAFLPASIYFGQLPGTDIASALAIQIGWVILFSILVQIVWSGAKRHITIQGG